MKSCIRLTHLNSIVPTAVEGSIGVKKKKFRGEIRITSYLIAVRHGLGSTHKLFPGRESISSHVGVDDLDARVRRPAGAQDEQHGPAPCDAPHQLQLSVG